MYKSLLLFAAVVAFACLGGCSQCGGSGCGSGAVKYCDTCNMDTWSACDTGTSCSSPCSTCNWNFFGNLCNACKTTSSSCGCNTCKTEHISCNACDKCATAAPAKTVCDTGCSGTCLPYIPSHCPEACPTTSCPPASACQTGACPTTYFRSSGCASCSPAGSCPPITTQPANSFKTGNGNGY